MLIFTVGQNARTPVVFLDSATKNPMNGIIFSSVVATVIKPDGTMVDLTLTSNDWEQKTSGAYATRGYYNIILPAFVLDQEGIYQYGAATAGAEFYPGVIHVRANTEKHVYDRLGLPVAATISADLQNISAGQGGDGGFSAVDRQTLLDVKTKTDLIGTETVASKSDVDNSAVGFTSSDRSNLQAVKNKTDNIGTAAVASQQDCFDIRGPSNGIDLLGNSINRRLNIDDLADAIRVIKSKTDVLPADPASNSYLGGTGYDPLVDSLHQLALAAAGGEGGFGPQDRADLQAVKSKTANLPPDPASTTDVISARDVIIGTNDPYGAQSISDIYWELKQVVEPRTNGIPYGETVATTAYIDIIKGPNWQVTTSTLQALRDAIGTGQFNESDRTLLTQARDNTGDTNTKVTAIKAKTDNLPSDPASNSHIDEVLGGGTYVFTPEDHDMLVSIRNKTDNLPLDPASATDGFNTTDRNVLAAVRSKTDLLPPDPAATTSVTALSNKVGTPRTTIAGDIGEIEDLLVSE